jgi:IclR family transcriptional regulator, acetate operon repressor
MAGSLLSRALHIVELLGQQVGGLHLQSLADELDVPKSAVHRLLAELTRLGYVRKSDETGRYLLTTKVVSLGFRYLAESGVQDVAQPILEDLARKTGELVRLGVVDGDAQVWVAKAQGARSGLRYDPDMGSQAQLSCTATGLAWLAALPEAEALRLVGKQGFGKLNEYGPQAPRTLASLRQRMAQARAAGYAWVVDSSAPGTSAMAATLRHPVTKRVLGTVSVAGPSVRLTEERMAALAPIMLEAAAELSAASVGSAWLSDPGHGPTVRLQARRK